MVVRERAPGPSMKLTINRIYPAICDFIRTRINVSTKHKNAIGAFFFLPSPPAGSFFMGNLLLRYKFSICPYELSERKFLLQVGAKPTTSRDLTILAIFGQVHGPSIVPRYLNPPGSEKTPTRRRKKSPREKHGRRELRPSQNYCEL